MSYEFYKVLHVFSVIIFAILGMMAIYKDKLPKAAKITLGTFSLLVLVGGMGLLARIGVSHGQGFPTWVSIKIVIWLALAALFGIISKRGVQNKMMPTLVSGALGFGAIVLAVYKSFA